MAQTRKRRRRKHRGTQAGSVDRRSRGRPKNRAEARSQARSRTAQRQDHPPTWRSAINRGLLAAGIFFLLMLLAFGRPFVQALALAVFMLTFYVPFGYLFDTVLYRRRQRQKQKAREQRAG
jgi:Flp pilus assembly protein TadB